MKRLFFAAALALAACLPAAAQTAPERDAMSAALAAQAAYCTAREDTAHPAFHGCIDWHSSVHGAWALAAHQRRTGDRTYAAHLEALLDPAALEREVRDILARPDFEMPYGRAWFLRLHREWRAMGGDDRLDELADIIAGSLAARYRKQVPDPRAGRYGSDSWAILNLHQWAENNDEGLESVTIALVREHFMRDPERSCDLSLETQGFIAVCVT